MKAKASGYVYLVLAPTSGLYKIGFTTAPANRVKALKAVAGEVCLLVHTIKTNNAPRLEAEMHATHAARRVSGEWFRLDAEHVAEFCARGEQVYAEGKAIRQSQKRRLVAIPEALAAALEEVAEEEFNNLAVQVRIACLERLKQLGRAPSGDTIS